MTVSRSSAYFIASSDGFAKAIAQRPGAVGYGAPETAFRDLDLLQHDEDFGLGVYRVEIIQTRTHDGVIRSVGAVVKAARPAAASEVAS